MDVNRDFRIFLIGSFQLRTSYYLPFILGFPEAVSFEWLFFFSEIRQFPDFHKPSQENSITRFKIFGILNSAESLLSVHTGLNESQGRLIVAFSIPVRRDTARYFIYIFKNVPS